MSISQQCIPRHTVRRVTAALSPIFSRKSALARGLLFSCLAIGRHCESSTKVVQSHRQLRTYSSGFLVRHFIGAGRNSRGRAINPWPVRGKTATELDRCPMGVSCGLAAAHSRCRHSGGARRDGRHQSEPDRRDAPSSRLGVMDRAFQLRLPPCRPATIRGPCPPSHSHCAKWAP